jgi:hypothetical protein
MKIDITVNGSTFSVEREGFDAEVAFDDFLNLLFISGVDKKDEQAISNSCNL